MAAKWLIFHHTFRRYRHSSGNKKVDKWICPVHHSGRAGPGLKSVCASGGDPLQVSFCIFSGSKINEDFVFKALVWQVRNTELFLPSDTDLLSDHVQSLWDSPSGLGCTPALGCRQLQAVRPCPTGPGSHQHSQPPGNPLPLTHSSSFRAGTQHFFCLFRLQFLWGRD